MTAAWSMDNIEADAAYERGIKDQIQAEFLQGLKGLKAQADGLGMEVREKDIIALREHMYEKAILMGRCYDKAFTYKKTVSNKIKMDDYVKDCVATHLKFIGWLESAKKTRSLEKCEMQARKIGTSGISRSNVINPPYDFLGYKEGTLAPDVTDYVALKDCYDSRSKSDKYFDE